MNKRKIYGTSIQQKILYSISAILIITLSVMGICSAIVIRNYTYKMAVNHSEQLLKVVSQNMNQVISIIDNSSKQLSLNDQVKDYCQNASSLSEYERIMRDLELRQSIVDNIIYSSSLISGMIVYPAEGDPLSFGGDQYLEISDSIAPIINEIQNQEYNGPFWMSNHKIKSGYSAQNVVSFFRPVLGTDGSQIGITEIQISSEQMLLNLDEFDFDTGSEILVLDERGMPALNDSGNKERDEAFFKAAKLQTEQKKSSIKENVHGTEYILNCTELNNQWMIICYQPADNLTKPAGMVILIIIIAGISMLVIMVIVSRNISRQLIQPIKNVITATQKMEDIIIPIEKEDEIVELFNNYNTMMARIREAELDTLRAQISPHFLYNTLNSIKCRALIDGNEDIGKMTQWLINLLELSINNHNEYTSVEEELQMLESYVGLQKMRSDKTFIYYTSVQTEALKYCLIPKMILQTLVENSILHGLDMKCGHPCISVTVTADENSLFIDVEDNGIGMSEEKIRQIMSNTANDTHNRMNRIGLYNVHQRIQLYFGEDYGITIKSEEGKGTRVTVTLPRITDWKTVRWDNR